MTKIEVIGGNKMITEFMGLEKCDRCPGDCGKYKIGAGIYMNHEELGYHKSWDWLMPVVEKIEDLFDKYVLKVYVSINGRNCDIWNYFDPESVLRSVSDTSLHFKQRKHATTKIEATYEACLNFINWYNNHKQ